jgi:hypothetical protein
MSWLVMTVPKVPYNYGGRQWLGIKIVQRSCVQYYSDEVKG